LDNQIIVIILDHMNEVIELVEDNLVEYISDPSVIVAFTQKTCMACVRIKPKLYEIPKEHTVIIVDCDKFFRSSKLMPGGIDFYPTFGLFKNGYFIKELTQKEIINQTLD